MVQGHCVPFATLAAVFTITIIAILLCLKTLLPLLLVLQVFFFKCCEVIYLFLYERGCSRVEEVD